MLLLLYFGDGTECWFILKQCQTERGDCTDWSHRSTHTTLLDTCWYGVFTLGSGHGGQDQLLWDRRVDRTQSRQWGIPDDEVGTGSFEVYGCKFCSSILVEKSKHLSFLLVVQF